MARKKKAEAKAPEKAAPAPEQVRPEPGTRNPKPEKPATPLLAAPRQAAVPAPEPQRLLAAPPLNLPPPAPQDKHATIKAAATIILLALAIAAGAYFLFMQPGGDMPVPGAEVNAATFAGILSNAQRVYVVMDLRGAANDTVRHNIMQCATDFTFSLALSTGKEAVPYSFENSTCFTSDGTATIQHCIGSLGGGVAIYVHPGNESRTYINMMDVGLGGSTYVPGTCNIGTKKT